MTVSYNRPAHLSNSIGSWDLIFRDYRGLSLMGLVINYYYDCY